MHPFATACSLTTSHNTRCIASFVTWHRFAFNLFHRHRYLCRLQPRFLAMSLSKPAFDSVRLGNDRHGFTVQLLPFPRSDAPLLEKVQAFACFEEIVRQHRSQLNASTVQQAYADNIPVSSSASASEEANRVSGKLYNSFFDIANLTCLGFFRSDGTKVAVAVDPCDRSSDISFIHFEAKIDPASFSSALIGTPSHAVQHYLKLPQFVPPANPATSTTLATHDESETAAPKSPTNDDNSFVSHDAPAMKDVRKVFADSGDPTKLDLTEASVVRALASIVKTSTADQDLNDIFTPDSARRQLFANDSSNKPQASPGILRYLTTATASAHPSFCGTLDFLDSQALFDAVFPALDRKPIPTLHRPASTHTVSTDDVETAIQACLSECRMLVFKNGL
jgi:hypothetical protein